MDFKKFNSTWQSTITSNRLLVLGNVALVAVVLLQASAITASKERIVLTPAHISEKMEVSWDEATPGYYKAVSHWLSGTLASVSTQNVTFVKSAVEQFFAPAVKRELLVQVDKAANDPLKRIAGSTAWFEAKSIYWEDVTKKVFVSGDLMTLNAGKPRAEKTSVTYEYRMRMENGLPMVVEFNSYDGGARTVSFFQKNSQKLEADEEL